MKRFIIIASLLATSISASAKDNTEACTFVAENADIMLMALENGHSPSEVLRIYQKVVANKTGVKGNFQPLLAVAMMSASKGRKSGPQHIGEVFMECMSVK